MMHALRFFIRTLGVVTGLLVGLLTVITVFPWARAGVRAWLTRHWSCAMLAVCGLKVRIHGQPILHGAVLTVANHVSWIDIFVLNRVRATAFIAKSEIRRWPLIGWLAAGAGTLFIARGARHAVRTVSRQMHQRFQAGGAVGLFPEGTTTTGETVQPFHASLFAPALDACVTVQPVVLRFFHHNARSPCAAFVGEETLVANLWRVLGETGLSVQATYLPALSIAGANGQVQDSPQTRQSLARAAQAAIACVLHPVHPVVHDNDRT